MGTTLRGLVVENFLSATQGKAAPAKK